jgi:hypothetical protein
MEIWKPIKNYEGLYEISNLGRVKSLDRFIKHNLSDKFIKGKILKPWDNSHGYLQVKLFKNGFAKMPKVHRLVADAFLYKLDYQDQVNHKNSIRSDNRLENLEWVSNRENCSHKTIDNNINKLPCVTYHKQRGKWRARIRHDSKQIHIGLFKTQEEAYQARLNFQLNNNIINKYI